MDNGEAKFILRAYRPNGADAADATFADALSQAKKDPELARWFDRELALDRAVASRLRAVAPPENLRDTILAGGKVTTPPRARWTRPLTWALAAGLAITLLWPMSLSVVHRQRDGVGFADYAMNDTLHGQHANHGEGAERLEKFLETNAAHVASSGLPVSYEQLRTTGCRTLEYSGHEVAELCFLRSGQWFHLYVMPKFGHEIHGPEFHEAQGAVAAQWTDAQHTYVVATTANVAALRQLL